MSTALLLLTVLGAAGATASAVAGVRWWYRDRAHIHGSLTADRRDLEHSCWCLMVRNEGARPVEVVRTGVRIRGQNDHTVACLGDDFHHAVRFPVPIFEGHPYRFHIPIGRIAHEQGMSFHTGAATSIERQLEEVWIKDSKDTRYSWPAELGSQARAVVRRGRKGRAVT